MLDNTDVCVCATCRVLVFPHERLWSDRCRISGSELYVQGGANKPMYVWCENPCFIWTDVHSSCCVNYINSIYRCNIAFNVGKCWRTATYIYRKKLEQKNWLSGPTKKVSFNHAHGSCMLEYFCYLCTMHVQSRLITFFCRGISLRPLGFINSVFIRIKPLIMQI